VLNSSPEICRHRRTALGYAGVHDETLVPFVLSDKNQEYLS